MLKYWHISLILIQCEFEIEFPFCVCYSMLSICCHDLLILMGAFVYC